MRRIVRTLAPGREVAVASPGSFGFHGRMRSCLRLLPLLVLLVPASARGLLDEALAQFRPDPPRGWSYTQTTVAEGKSTVERHDAAQPEFARWTLLEKDGRAPTEEERRTYAEMRSRRSRSGTAPKITEQFDLATVERVSESTDQATFRCRLKPGEGGDRTAPNLRATIVVHKSSRTIESIELGSVGEFSPSLGVTIATMKTLLTYSPPEAPGQPAFPRRVATHVRGQAFWFKSLDADMTITYSDYEKATKPRR